MRNKKLIHYLATALLVIAIGWLIKSGLSKLSRSCSYQLFGQITSQVNTERKIVALTLDDAPGYYTDSVLNILKEKNIKATFYIIGNKSATDFTSLRHIVEAGHDMGNHSYTHKPLTWLPSSVIAQEVEKTNALIRKAGYNREITFRPPFGQKLAILPWYLKQHGIQTIMWSVEPKGADLANTGSLISYVSRLIRPGSIILIHPFCADACESTRKALPALIDTIKQQGYSFVTISELLKEKT